MSRVISRTAGLLSVVGLTVGMSEAAYAPGTNLYINGALASSRVIQQNGIAYVPIADVAKAMNEKVVVRSDGYDITSGGANQANGTNGKIGDKLTDGQIVFSVVKVTRTDTYDKQFDTGSVKPDNDKDDLVVVVLRVKNALPKPIAFSLRGGDLTALTDKNEHSYKRTDDDWHAPLPTLLPGSAVDFALVYSMPKGEKPGDFVYQRETGGDRDLKESTFRISLASVSP